MTSAVTASDELRGYQHDQGTSSEKTLASQDREHIGGLQNRKAPEKPIDGGYGWVCVGAVFLVNFHTWGLNSVRYLKIGWLSAADLF